MTSCEFDEKLATKPKFVAQSSPTPFFNLQQMFLLRDKLMAQGEIRETWMRTCNETMLLDKLRVSVSRISPP